ncbi:MAG: glycosyltransferase [Pseudomonadota bacterium]
MPFADVAAVVIGRNEGARLVRCLASLSDVERVVYVDSGSTDGSTDAAKAAGAEVVTLDVSTSFTAARARNAGAALTKEPFIQFVDGDCEVQPGWIEAARQFLEEEPKAAVACGRRRETAPDASIYNALADDEWDTPVGEAGACGGDALIRAEALREAGGYRDDLIAGEEPELCLRIRRLGWSVWRLDHEMTRHDAAMTRFSQWWRRSRRAGHAFAEGAFLHGAGRERHYVKETARALGWAALPIPAAIAFWPFGAALLLVYPAQIARLALKRGGSFGWAWGFFTVVGKFAEAQGVAQFALSRLTRRRSRLIEYK